MITVTILGALLHVVFVYSKLSGLEWILMAW